MTKASKKHGMTGQQVRYSREFARRQWRSVFGGGSFHTRTTSGMKFRVFTGRAAA